MTIKVKVTANKNQTKVEQLTSSSDNLAYYKVWLKSVPERGKANAELILLLADFFGVKPINVRIISGQTSPLKIIKIDI